MVWSVTFPRLCLIQMKISASKLRRLERLIHDQRRLAVACSGGVDSTLVAFLAHRILGENSLALTAVTEFVPEAHVKAAGKICRQLKIPHNLLQIPLLKTAQITANTALRCYYCKRSIMQRILREARRQGFKTLADGTNRDDLREARPGEKALQELKVSSPLAEAGIGKAEVRVLARSFGLPNWQAPSYSCLATRIRLKEEITREKLKMVESAERLLSESDFQYLRVRLSEKTARIEVERNRIPLLVKKMDEKMLKKLKQAGFQTVCIDLEGYRRQEG